MQAGRAGATGSDPPSTERAGPSYARFLVFLEAWILSAWKLRRIEGLWSALHALRPEASADFCQNQSVTSPSPSQSQSQASNLLPKLWGLALPPQNFDNKLLDWLWLWLGLGLVTDWF